MRDWSLGIGTVHPPTQKEKVPAYIIQQFGLSASLSLL